MAKKQKRGKYYSHVEPKLILVEGWARDGLIDAQIAKNLGVAYSTFKVYKNKHLALSTALKRGKEVADYEVENALFKRAMGYEYSEEKVDVETNASGKLVSRKITQTVKHIAPDTTAQIFWLKNRRPDKWRDRPAQTQKDQGVLSKLIEGLQDSKDDGNGK